MKIKVIYSVQSFEVVTPWQKLHCPEVIGKDMCIEEVAPLIVGYKPLL